MSLAAATEELPYPIATNPATLEGAVVRPIKYRTESERREARRKYEREYYAAHRETISAKRTKHRRERAERMRKHQLLAVPQTAGKAIYPQRADDKRKLA